MEFLLKQARCLPVGRKCSKQKTNIDQVERLACDMEIINTEAAYGMEDHKLELCKDVQMQLQSILSFLKDLREGEENSKNPQKVTPLSAEEESRIISQFIAADLPVQLLAQLANLEFEARKDVMNVFCALLWKGLPEELGAEVLEYLRDHPRIFPLLIKGFDHDEVFMHCGVVLRSCLRHEVLADAFLNSGLVMELVGHTRNPSMEIAADAFSSLREVMTDHKEVSGKWLHLHFDEFFKLYNPLLQCEDYVVQRQALTLLNCILLDRNYQKAMLAYVKNEQHLQIVMNLLRDNSHAIQTEAFHVFKIFVVNPRKPTRIQLILVKNKGKLVALLEGLQPLRADDTKFSEDQQNVISRLLPMTAPPKTTQGSNQTHFPRSSSSISMATTAEPDAHEAVAMDLLLNSTVDVANVPAASHCGIKL
eukprot:TRINITY_DN3856_c0_g2_i1.p1 TRINITY_DN3856_c0_g2~~TRINITY_DN3856_c0_g2_i1.p1  ORF type:complete len:421 (+),score=84.74 TRINITY_DN3856_c0_g2_i1:337-1599(+)